MISSFQSAFLDSLVDDLLLDTPCFVRVLRVLGEVRDGIRWLAGTRDTGNIMGVVDLNFICNQVEKGLYGWQECILLLSKIFSVIQEVCLWPVALQCSFCSLFLSISLFVSLTHTCTTYTGAVPHSLRGEPHDVGATS